MSLPPEFSNPVPDTSVNAAESDTFEFRRLLLWALGLGTLLVLVVFAGARVLIPLTPYQWEETAFAALPEPFPTVSHPDGERLQALLVSISKHITLPTPMKVRLGVVASETPNAFATLGGRVYVTTGLLENVASENELAMVLAHELAHLAARDPAVALGAGVSLSLIGAGLGLGSDGVTLSASQLSLLAFSRAQENAADELALAALRAHYGHTGGADAFFLRIQALRSTLDEAVPNFLSTHPSDAGRLARIRASQADWDPQRQPLNPWP